MMKIVKNLLLVSLLLLGFQAVAAPHPAAALSRQQKIDCYKTWNGKTFVSPDYTGERKFKNTSCYSGKGGNCSISSVRVVIGGEQVVNHKVQCANPRTAGVDVGNGTTSTGVEDVPQISDSAVDTNIACNGTGNCPIIQKYIDPAIKLLSVMVGIVAIAAIIIGAIQVTTSAGDPQKAASGKDHIRNALIGIVAYVFLYALLQWLLLGDVSS